MKVELWMVGKTSFPYLQEGINIYEKRLKHYLTYKSFIISDVKNAKHLNQTQIKQKEGILIEKYLEKGDFLVLLDERGKRYTSPLFAKFLEKQLEMSHKRIIFLIGGAYGFSESIYQRANSKLSLSDMTFSHQMVRLFATEQLYRAMTILKGEPYHHV